MRKRNIKHNDLLPWFTQDHGTLPAAYLASCEKFFKSIKQQASSAKLDKLQAASYSRIIKENKNAKKRS